SRRTFSTSRARTNTARRRPSLPYPDGHGPAHSPSHHPRRIPRARPGGLGRHRVGARVTGSRDVHLFSTLGRARRLFPAWLAYSGMMMPFGVLDRRTTELVILRVAHLRSSAYERAHHERIGARVGLSAAEVTRTTEDPVTAEWSEKLRAVLCAVDELVGTKDLADDTW